MGFQADNATTAPGKSNEQWKAQGFLNFYLPTKDGGRRKVGAIPLKSGKPSEKQLLDWLQADPEKNAQAMINAMVMEFQSATPTEGSAFELPSATE